MLLAAISLFLSTSHCSDATPDMDLMQLSPSDVHTSTLEMFLCVEEKRKDYLNIIYQFCSACWPVQESLLTNYWYEGRASSDLVDVTN